MAKPKKADVVAKLEAAGIVFDAESTVDELIALLPVDESKKDDESEDDGKGTATVLSKTGAPVRTYTKEVHGKEYKDLAKQYATKIGGSVR